MLSRLQIILPLAAAFLLAMITGQILHQFFLVDSIGAFGLHLDAFQFTLQYGLRVLLIVMVVSGLLSFINPRMATFFGFCLIVLVLLTQHLLHLYQYETGILLGTDLFGYSPGEIQHIASTASSAIQVVPWLHFIVTLGVGIGVSLINKRIKTQASTFNIFLTITLACSVFAWLIPAEPNQEKLTESEYLHVINPSHYFVSRTSSMIVSRKNYQPGAFSNYPFLHQTDTENPLGNWLETNETVPNIIFITVEGLGADFVGEDALYGGFTPFLDSLSRNSLYWKNCLSNTGRTFGALPSLLGSLPYAGNGFMAKGQDMPHHFTLLSLLKTEGYHSSFFYGGNANFDNQDLFLERQGIDVLLDEQKFPASYPKMAPNSEGASWGYPDKTLFEYSLKEFDNFPEKPKISFYLTISTHEPFICPDPKITDRANELLKLKENSREASTYSNYKNVFECLLYTDQSIRYFLNQFKKRKEFHNTIFIITGDHRLIPIPTANRLDRFRVPLIIYSPLQKMNFTSEQVVTHSQITPSLVSFLQENYRLDFPSRNAFISGPLPTSTSFGSELDIALMRSKNEISEYILGRTLLSDNQLFRIESGMKLATINDYNLKKTLQDKLREFQAKSLVAINENRLIPDSAEAFAPVETLASSKDLKRIESLKLINTPPDTLYMAANQYIRENQVEISRSILRFALDKSPNYHDLRILLARTYGWEGKYDSALYYLTQVLKRNDGYEDAYVAYSDVAYWSDQPILSKEMALKGLEKTQASPELSARVARILVINNEINEARTLIQKVLDDDPDNELANRLKNQIDTNSPN